MPYVKANALTAGNNAEADKLAENFEDARRYINRDIVKADLAADSVDFPEIVRGEYSDITGLHQFTFGHSWGNFNDRKLRQINPISGRIKNENQVKEDDQSNGQSLSAQSRIVEMYQTVPDTAIQIKLEHAALVTYRAWVEVVIPENYSVALEPVDKIAAHRWTTYSALRDPTVSANLDPLPLTTTSGGKHFDEIAFTSAGGTTSSWAGPIAQDPMRDTTAGNGFSSNLPGINYRRNYVITKTWELSAGLHNFGVVVDAHHDNGMWWTTNCTVEVEYI